MAATAATLAGLLLLAALTALAVLPVSALVPQKRCTYGAAGDLVGHEIFLNVTELQPVTAREYDYEVPVLTGCVLNGVVARVCDLFPPEISVQASLRSVTVRRLGPRLQPLRLHLTLYCDSTLPLH